MLYHTHTTTRHGIESFSAELFPGDFHILLSTWSWIFEFRMFNTTLNSPGCLQFAIFTPRLHEIVSWYLSARLCYNTWHIRVKKLKCIVVRALRLCTGRTAHRGSRGIALLFLDHGTRRGVRGQRRAPDALYPRERPGTHCTGGWEGPRDGLDRCGKYHPPPTSTCDCDEYLFTRHLCLAAFYSERFFKLYDGKQMSVQRKINHFNVIKIE
jgi:hypothetical protein